MKTNNVLRLGNLTIDTTNQLVRRQNKKINLRKKEFELLEFLARNKERVLNRLTILEYVWNYSAQVNTNTLEVHIAGLRKKIGKKLILTIPGLGYKLSTT